MLRVGRIDYANCTPLFSMLDKRLAEGDLEIVHGVPAELNRQLREGDIDLCPCSSIEYALHADQYLILDGHCIGSDGPVKSVLLFSKVPIEKLSGKTLLVTSESATSVALLKVLLARCFRLDGVVMEKTDSSTLEPLKDADAMLLIGDSALRAALSVSTGYCYDLGELWRDWTGLPFVFALWLVNKKNVAGHEDEVRSFLKHLDCVSSLMADEYERIALSSRESGWMGVKQLADYWRVISYRLDNRHLQGLNLFYDQLAELNLIHKRVHASESLFR